LPPIQGGPVIFADAGTTRYSVAGIVSAYQAVREPVYEGARDTGLTYKHKTGIIVAYTIDLAVQLGRANPIGLVVNDAP